MTYALFYTDVLILRNFTNSNSLFRSSSLLKVADLKLITPLTRKIAFVASPAFKAFLIIIIFKQGSSLKPSSAAIQPELALESYVPSTPLHARKSVLEDFH